jgi:hypothetical protein
MPFANKFRAMMGLPLPGDAVGDFIAESVEVADVRGGSDGHAYCVRIVLHGPGGIAGVRRALRTLFVQRVTTFSSYGNTCQLWFGKPETEGLGHQRYGIIVDGAGARIDLTADLERFLNHLAAEGHIEPTSDTAMRLIEISMEAYRADVERRMERYRRRLKRSEREPGV